MRMSERSRLVKPELGVALYERGSEGAGACIGRVSTITLLAASLRRYTLESLTHMLGQTVMNPYDQTGRLAEINSVNIHYTLQGDAAKPVLALINMASHNLTCWEVVLDDLLEDFQVLRFDLRGTGKSGWGEDSAFNFSQYADDLAGLLDELGIAHAFVLGVAYGARTAAQFALRHEDRLLWH